MDQQKRADDNERLRRLATEELASMRAELTQVLSDRGELHQMLNSLAVRLAQQEQQTAEAEGELEATRRELASMKAAVPEPHRVATRRLVKRLMPRSLKRLVKRFRASLNAGNTRAG